MSIEKEFVPYEQALALKELGFDEPCFGFYTEEYKKLIKNFCKYPINLPTKPFLAPIYSQAFRWFREKYGLMSSITPCSDGEFIFTIFDLNKCNLEVFVENIELFESEDSYDICEEAELECLKELIKIVKNDKKLS